MNDQLLLKKLTAKNRSLVTEIKELRSRERELLSQKKQLDNFFDNAPVELYLKDKEGRYLKINKQFEEIFCVKNEALVGKFPDTAHDPELATATRNQDMAVLTSGEINRREERTLLVTDNRIHTLLTIKFPLFDDTAQVNGLGAIVTDITELKDAEETLKATESRFRTMFMSAPVGMLLVDLKTTNLLEINPAYTRIVGRSVEEIKKIGWQKITHPDDLAENTHNLKQLQEGNIVHFKMVKRFIKPDNSIVWAELTVNAIDVQSDPLNSQYLAMLEDVTERKEFEEKIWHQANFDFLTGLPNRSMLQDRLSQTIKKARRDANEFAILLIDLDQFKDVNDTLGHNRGDELLVEASSRIKLCVRESDTVARLGGDEFVIILSELSYLSGVGTVAQNIIDTLTEPFHLGKNTAYISASIGITLYPKDGTESVNLIKNADQAMYAAKKQGRNCFQFFTSLMQQMAQQRMVLVNDMRNAIKNEEFVLYYQPIVELDSDQIFKAEALIRWQHPDRGLVSPIEFIPLAEETRMINEIGDWVFLEAAKQSKRWQSALRKDFQISVNASPIQFENSADFSWKNFLTALEIDGSSIGIEITESLLMTSDQSALNTLLEFRDAGIQVSLDDFGTGYSSLSYLRKFHIDYLKIDQSFVQNLDHESDDLALCSAIVVMAHTLGIKVIAEGIETQLQKDLLMSINCDFGQGYLFSRPVPANEFQQLFS